MKVVLDATDQRGVDVILDMVGGEYVARNMAAAAPDGRIARDRHPRRGLPPPSTCARCW